MSKLEEINERWQFDKPYLYGALIGVMFSVFSAIFGLVFRGGIDPSQLVFAPLSIIAFSLLFGLTAKDRRRRRDEKRQP